MLRLIAAAAVSWRTDGSRAITFEPWYAAAITVSTEVSAALSPPSRTIPPPLATYDGSISADGSDPVTFSARSRCTGCATGSAVERAVLSTLLLGVVGALVFFPVRASIEPTVPSASAITRAIRRRGRIRRRFRTRRRGRLSGGITAPSCRTGPGDG